MEISTQEGYEGVLPGSPPAEGKEWKQDWATVQVPRRPQPAPREALKPGVGTRGWAFISLTSHSLDTGCPRKLARPWAKQLSSAEAIPKGA